MPVSGNHNWKKAVIREMCYATECQLSSEMCTDKGIRSDGSGEDFDI